MPPVDRNNPVRGKGSSSTYSLMEFIQDYGDDAACLDFLWRQRFAPDGHTAHCPKCDQERRFHRVKSRPSYSCQSCGQHLHPTAGTIFHKSSTSLHLWFYAMYLMTSTRCGISAKQLERELGVTYKTAWRMFNRIRNVLMSDEGDPPLSGHVEVDETSVEGKPRVRLDRARAAQLRERSRATVIGMVERGGRVRLRVLPSRRGPGLKQAVRDSVAAISTIYTDEWPAYRGLDREYAGHHTIQHSARIYWGTPTRTPSRGSSATSRPRSEGRTSTSPRAGYQGYLNEFAWRYNHRHDGRAQFATLLLRAVAT